MALYPEAVRDASLQFDGACPAVANRDCGSEPGAVHCRIDTIGRALDAIALASASFDVQVIHPNSKLPPLPFDVRHSLTPAIAASFGQELPPEIAKALAEDPSFQQHLTESQRLSEQIRTLVATDARPELNVHSPWAAYVMASNDLVAFLVGGEYDEAQGRCLIETPSPLEADGMFDVLVGLQKRGSICGNGQLSDAAVEADRCALRALAKMDASMADPLRKQYGNDSMRADFFLPLGVGRRLAIDAFATLDLAAMRDLTDAARSDVDARRTRTHSLTRSGYLNEQLRLFLFAATLQRREDLLPSTVRLCGDPALRFAAAIQHDDGRCGGERVPLTRLAELFKAALSDKVTERWSRNEELGNVDALDAFELRCAPEKYCFGPEPCPFTLF